MCDYLSELHGNASEDDLPSTGECIAETEEQIRVLESGNYASVPPWMTPEQCLEQLRAELARYRARQ